MSGKTNCTASIDRTNPEAVFKLASMREWERD
jgi:hypothetical protein